MIAWFAGGRQLAVGPVETVGTVGDVVWSKKRDGLVVDPINGKVKLHSPRKHDIVSILDDDNAVSTVTLILSDTNQLLAFRDKQTRQEQRASPRDAASFHESALCGNYPGFLMDAVAPE